MSAEIILISKMEKDGRITAEQAKEMIETALRNEFSDSRSVNFSAHKTTSY